MSATTVKLLQAAADIAGGTKALAEQLGIGEALLAKYMADVRPTPDPLLLRAVDIILGERQSRLLREPRAPAQNPLDGSRATSDGGAE